MFDWNWNVDKYKDNYDPEHWELCRTFMEIHKTKYPEQKLVHLTEAFYQIGVYGSSYDPKTTRMVSALSIDVLDNFLKAHPGSVKHPFRPSEPLLEIDLTKEDQPGEEDSSTTSKTKSIWDVSVDKTIIVNVLVMSKLKELLKGFVIIYDVRKASTMDDNKINILEDSFKRSKFGPILWVKTDTNNNICPIRLALKWKGIVLAEAMGTDEKTLRTRIAQAMLSKIASFSHGIEAKWSYYRDGRLNDLFDAKVNPRKSFIFKIIPRYQFKSMAEISSFIDTFANSDTFAEFVFAMDFSSQDKKQITDYVTKMWAKKLTYRTVSKIGVKSRTETHLCVYHLRTGEELRRWLESSGGSNDRYRIVPPGEHRRAGGCDVNVREVLTSCSGDAQIEKEKEEAAKKQKEEEERKQREESEKKEKEEAERKRKEEAERKQKEEAERKQKEEAERKEKEEAEKKHKEELEKKQREEAEKKQREEDKRKQREESERKQKETSKQVQTAEEVSEADLEKLLDGFVLFYDAKKNSEIDKDDWFSVLCDSFKKSKFGALEVLIESIRPLRTRCSFKWKNKLLASAEGLTETQAKTAATLQLISKLEPFTFIIQAKEDYFNGGKVPPFMDSPDPAKNDSYRVYKRKDLPSYYTIFQTIDEFVKNPSYKEIVFGKDFPWELKNEIVVYLKAKGLDYRYFTNGDSKPWTHMAVYHTIDPEKLKNHLMQTGGENDKYKLIPPPKVELITNKTTEAQTPKVPEKVAEKPAPIKPTVNPSGVNSAAKRKLPQKEPPPAAEEPEGNKIQINLKKFKKDKVAVDYPEDTGGDFPGLILWIGIRKNSTCQKIAFNILLDSFRLSKYGELSVEEDEETVWGRKEPMKKCIIKANRKVLAVGLGESKTEAKNTAALQVLRQLRKNCFAIQAKESYYKEGKATPFDFNPDPAKEHVYRVMKRKNFKDRTAILNFVRKFANTDCSEEVIFGDDFAYEEREFILQHCRLQGVSYRLMKCQSTSKGLHTHVAIYHQQHPPSIKAALTKAGGEDDMYRLIQPGEKITSQNSDVDLWPDTPENGKQEKNENQSSAAMLQKALGVINDKPETKAIESMSHPNNLQVVTQAMEWNSEVAVDGPKRTPIVIATNVPVYNQPHPDMPLTFGPLPPQPIVYVGGLAVEEMMKQPGELSASVVMAPVGELPSNPGVEEDLRDELARKRKVGQERKVYDMTTERKVIRNENEEGWSRQVFVAESESGPKGGNLRKQDPDLRQKLIHRRDRSRSNPRQRMGAERNRNRITPDRRRISPDRGRRRISPDRGDRFRRSPERDIRRISPGREFRRISPGREFRRISPGREFRRISPEREFRRISPERRFERASSRERFRSFDDSYESRIIRNRGLSAERRMSPSPNPFLEKRERWGLRSGERSLSPPQYRDYERVVRSQSPVMVFRDLWDNISERLSQSIFMYKYVKQDSTTETNPFALLRATRSLNFNVDFEFISQQVRANEWQVSIELVTDDTLTHPLVGEGVAATEEEARYNAACHAVDTMQKSCYVIEPNFHYFMEGGVPEFIRRKSPMKTGLYEIIQNLDPSNSLDRYTIDVMLSVFTTSGLEDLFFLATDFSYVERVLVIEVANQKGLWWRLFGPRHPDAKPDDVVSTQHVCVMKQKTALQLARELLDNRGSTQKYTLVDPRENRITRPGLRLQRKGVPSEMDQGPPPPRQQKKITVDCFFFLNSKCIKGENCPFRHNFH